MEYSNILKEISDGIKRKEFAVFCGAGISFNSGLPGAKELKQCILEKLMDNEDDVEEIMSSKLPFEAFMEVLAENFDISKILDIFKQGEPTANHIFIAKLAKAGLIKTIATTNFDMLIEAALEKEGFKRGEDFEVYFKEEQFSEIDFDALNKSNKISLFKLHGSIEDEESIRTTVKAVASRLLSEKRLNTIRHIFSNKNHKNVLVLGYSCSDAFDITSQIQSIENSENRVFLVEHAEATQIKDIKNPKLRNGNENPFNRFNGYIAESNTNDLVKEIWNDLIKEEYELKTYKIEWQNFVGEWFKNLEKYIVHSICGIMLYTVSDFKKAIEYYEKGLKICREIGDKSGEGRCYTNLGIAYRNLGDSKKAIEYYEKGLKICLEIGDKSGEGICYTNLGAAYVGLGDSNKAIEYCEKGLKICLEIGDKSGEGRCYTNLGAAYYSLGDSKKAIEYCEKDLEICLEIGDKSGEGRCYTNLGVVYDSLGDSKKAIEYYEKGLKICLEIGDKSGEGKCYGNLGVAYNSLGDFRKAIEYYEKAIPIFIETFQSHYLKSVYENISIAYYIMKNPEKAEEYKRKADKIKI